MPEVLMEPSRRVSVRIPVRQGVNGRLGKAFFTQIETPDQVEELDVSPFREGRLRGILGIGADNRRYLFVARKTTVRPNVHEILVTDAASDLDRFVAEAPRIDCQRIHPVVLAPRRDAEAIKQFTAKVRDTWRGDIELRGEAREGDRITRPGFRPPQIGALHALKAHWMVSQQVATVVMPTGTGKTDTMIAAAISEQAERLLIIVPSDVLRAQVASSFSKLGMLRSAALIGSEAANPVIALVRGQIESVEDVDEIFDLANVVVTTMASAAGASDNVQARMAERSTHLFVDEAHHVAAKTWRSFRRHFDAIRVVQFTATPFRNDGLRVDGKFIFSYPLRLAQEADYFKPIHFESVTAFDRGSLDELIAEKVCKALEDDIAAGYDHVAMARCRNKKRAAAVYELYARHWPQSRPVLLHSGLSKDERSRAMRRLENGEAHLVVCVDMLGEGFDLPRLKVAGLHDPKKSEAPTLQFIGRFTRFGTELGAATVVAGTLPDDGSFLSRLYAEDADWNYLISRVGTLRTEAAIRREEIFQGFEDIQPRFPLETLKPRMSTVVYKTSEEPWDPQRIQLFDRGGEIVDGPFINRSKALAILVVRRTERPKWTTARSAVDTTFDLVMLYWNQDTCLLYVHSSSGERVDELATCVCGEDIKKIRGENIFRAMAGLKRPVLYVLGLSETRRRRIRHTQLQGTDIAQEVKPSVGNRTRAKTNLFVAGFDDSARTTVGCSQKGKIWSQQATDDFAAWTDWCDVIGAKLLNTSLSTDELMESFIKPELVPALPPDKVPLSVILNDDILGAVEERWIFVADGQEHSLLNVGIELAAHDLSEGLLFDLCIGGSSVHCRMTITEHGAFFERLGGPDVTVTNGGRTFSLAEWLHNFPPTVHFTDGDSLIGDEFFPLPANGVPGEFPSENTTVWDWRGVDITKESYRGGPYGDTVQGVVIAKMLEAEEASIVFNDDGAGESADVVVLYDRGRALHIEFYHCKYSRSAQPGNRIADLYEVCGQAQQSIRWCEHPKRLLEHLLKRELQRQRRGGPSGFEKGAIADLKDLIARNHELQKSFKVLAVQPGYSLSGIRTEHMQPLAATHSLLMETFEAPFELICSQ